MGKHTLITWQDKTPLKSFLSSSLGMKSVNAPAGRSVDGDKLKPDHMDFLGNIEDLRRTASSRINLRTSLKTIGETHANITAEEIVLLVKKKRMLTGKQTQSLKQLNFVISLNFNSKLILARLKLLRKVLGHRLAATRFPHLASVTEKRSCAQQTSAKTLAKRTGRMSAYTIFAERYGLRLSSLSKPAILLPHDPVSSIFVRYELSQMLYVTIWLRWLMF